MNQKRTETVTMTEPQSPSAEDAPTRPPDPPRHAKPPKHAKTGRRSGRTGRFFQRWVKHGKLLARLYQANFRAANLVTQELKTALRKNKGPILVGPWVSEVGFEVLYWIPFLRMCFERYRVDPKRVTVLSRGGARCWYEGLCGNYVEIFDYISPEEFVAENSKREENGKGKKQFDLSPFERRLIDEATTRAGLKSPAVLHPSAMYQLFRYYWVGLRDRNHVFKWCQYALLDHAFDPPPGLPEPGQYYAVKFYFSACFPKTPENVRFIRTLIARLSQRSKIVLLNTGLELDDHSDSVKIDLDNVIDASSLMTPRNNLEVQTAIVARSKGLF